MSPQAAAGRHKLSPGARGDGCRSARSDDETRYQRRVLENFLTQRAIQTLIFNFKESRDHVSAGWVERFANHTGVALYHGTRGLRLDSSAYLSRMLTADTEEIVVTMTRTAASQGGSGTNPYLRDRHFNYSVDIFPRELGERLLSLRLQLAEEWIADLSRLEVEHAEHWRAYRSGTDAGARLAMPALEGFDPSIGCGECSAYRGGNFDLLTRLSAQEGVRRTARQMERVRGRQASYTRRFLLEFYETWARKFDGDAPYHVARDFQRALCAEPPRVFSDDPTRTPLLADPLAIAERVMGEQLAVVECWRELLANAPAENARVRRSALESSFR